MKYLSPEVKNIGLKPKFTALYSSTNKRMSVSALYLHGLKPRICRSRSETKGFLGGIERSDLPPKRGDSQERRVGFDEVEYRLVRCPRRTPTMPNVRFG